MSSSFLLNSATDAASQALARLRKERAVAEPTGMAVNANPTLRDLVARTRAGDVVWLAAILERFMNGSVNALLVEIRSSGLAFQMLRPSLMSLCSRFAALGSLKDYSKVWDERLALVAIAVGSGAAPFDGITEPLDGHTIREQHLKTLWRIFGLPGSHLPDVRLNVPLREIADARNLVAHGDEDSLVYGRNHTNEQMLRLIDAVETIVIHVSLSIEEYLRRKLFLR